MVSFRGGEEEESDVSAATAARSAAAVATTTSAAGSIKGDDDAASRASRGSRGSKGGEGNSSRTTSSSSSKKGRQRLTLLSSSVGSRGSTSGRGAVHAHAAPLSSSATSSTSLWNAAHHLHHSSSTRSSVLLSSQELLSARIAQEMSSVMDVDDDWDRHQRIQLALQRHNFTLNKLRFNELDLCGRDKELVELKEAFHGVVVAAAAAAAAAAADEEAKEEASNPSAAATRRRSSVNNTTKPPKAPPKVAVVNVVGRSGTGKTRLCQELKTTVVTGGGGSTHSLHHQNSQHRGFFLEGKFDWQNRQEPFTGLVSALSQFKGHVLERGDDFAKALANELWDAIGGDAQVLTSVVPGLEELLSIRTRLGKASGDELVEEDASPKLTGEASSTTEEMEVIDTDKGDDKLMTRSSRLQYLFRQFFKCICRPEHPVVLLLDDMQWSDESTRNLLSTLVTDPTLSSLLVLATCREEEVDSQHPWNLLLSEWQQSRHSKKVAVRHIVLSNLDQPAVLNIVQSSLRCSEERTFRLAEIVHSKSSGNAMYVIQFLTSLYDDGLLRYNVGSMSWMWDEASVRTRFVTDNVVDLTTAKLKRLPPELRTLVMMAACLGRTFDRSKLELIRNQARVHELLGSKPSMMMAAEVSTSTTTASTIGKGVDEAAAPPEAPRSMAAEAEATAESPASMAARPGVDNADSVTALPNKEEKDTEGDDAETTLTLEIDWLSASLHRLTEDSVVEYVSQLRTYCFAHDMIQEAAFRLIPEEVRAPVQREVGRALLQRHKIKELDDNSYFRAIELSNVVGTSLADRDVINSASYEDRRELAVHNNAAGQRAMGKAAFASALKYFEAGLQRLGDDAFRDTELFLDLSSGAVESAYCSGKLEAMELHMTAALKVDTHVENKVRVYMTRILSYGSQDKNALAIATGRQVLIEMGITRLPKRPGTLHVVSELLKTKWVLRNHTEETLMALPTLEDERWLQAMSIIDMMQAVAYCSDMNLFAVMNLRMLRWTVRYGVCRFSPTVLATYGVILCQIGELQPAQLFGAASMVISDRLNATASRSKTIICAYALVAPWQAPYRNVFKMLQYGHKLGMKTGELEIAMYNLAQYNFALAATSAMPLKAYIHKIRSDNKLMHEYGQDGIRNFGLLMTQFALNLVGPVDRPTVMTGEAVDEAYFRSTYTSVEHLLLIGWLNFCSLQLAYYFEEYDRADECSRHTEDFAKVAGGHPYVYRHAFFCSLTAFAMARKMESRRGRSSQLRRAARFARQVRTWSNAGNVNCSHLTQLLDAERMSFRKGKDAETKRLYNAAITTAHKNGYLNDKALAHERAFFFHLRLATGGKGESSGTSNTIASSSVTATTTTAAASAAASTSRPEEDWFWAQHHYKDAVEAYCDWNAFQKAKHLVDTYGARFKLTASAFSSLSMEPENVDESDSR